MSSLSSSKKNRFCSGFPMAAAMIGQGVGSRWLADPEDPQTFRMKKGAPRLSFTAIVWNSMEQSFFYGRSLQFS